MALLPTLKRRNRQKLDKEKSGNKRYKKSEQHIFQFHAKIFIHLSGPLYRPHRLFAVYAQNFDAAPFVSNHFLYKVIFARLGESHRYHHVLEHLYQPFHGKPSYKGDPVFAKNL